MRVGDCGVSIRAASLNMCCIRVYLVVLVALVEVHAVVNYLYFYFSTTGGLVHQYVNFVGLPVPIDQGV